MTLPSSVPHIGALASGTHDAITDVAGVTVGHCTLDEGALQTGVTVIRPHGGDCYRARVPAAAVVINGFGKSTGLMQLQELGQIDTPIALTNTFSVPAVAQAQIRQCIAANPRCGRGQDTVNPLVLECNDGFLNDIQRMAITGEHYQRAFDSAGVPFAQGSVGAGRGMSCFGLKGGIGSASRIVAVRPGVNYTLGALVLANFGKPEQLLWAGDRLGARLAAQAAQSEQPATMARTTQTAADTPDSQFVPAAGPRPEQGSIIMLLATDAPLDARQLRRLALRAGAGLARTGSVFGHGSGDVALAFSTAYTLPQDPLRPMPAVAMLHEALLDALFQAAADGTEQAILHALWHASSVTGRDGNRREALRALAATWGQC